MNRLNIRASRSAQQGDTFAPSRFDPHPERRDLLAQDAHPRVHCPWLQFTAFASKLHKSREQRFFWDRESALPIKHPEKRKLGLGEPHDRVGGMNLVSVMVDCDIGKIVDKGPAAGWAVRQKVDSIVIVYCVPLSPTAYRTILCP